MEPAVRLAARRSTLELMLAREPGRRSAATMRAQILGALRFPAAVRSTIAALPEAQSAVAALPGGEVARPPAARTAEEGVEAAGPTAERTMAVEAEAAVARAPGRRTARRMTSRPGSACRMWCSSWCPPAASLASASSVWNPLQIR